MAIKIFNLLVTQITRNKTKVAEGTMSTEEYKEYKDETLERLDVYLLGKRITPEQYQELVELLG